EQVYQSINVGLRWRRRFQLLDDGFPPGGIDVAMRTAVEEDQSMQRGNAAVRKKRVAFQDLDREINERGVLVFSGREDQSVRQLVLRPLRIRALERFRVRQPQRMRPFERAQTGRKSAQRNETGCNEEFCGIHAEAWFKRNE